MPDTVRDTIFALSSGRPPAAIAVVRISGPQAGEAVETLTGKLPAPRKAVLSRVQGQDGELIDQALVLWFPGPHSETGEDVAELQLHGGRAVVAGQRPARSRMTSGGRSVRVPSRAHVKSRRRGGKLARKYTSWRCTSVRPA